MHSKRLLWVVLVLGWVGLGSSSSFFILQYGILDPPFVPLFFFPNMVSQSVKGSGRRDRTWWMVMGVNGAVVNDFCMMGCVSAQRHSLYVRWPRTPPQPAPNKKKKRELDCHFYDAKNLGDGPWGGGKRGKTGLENT